MLKSCMVKFLSSGGKSRFHTSSMVEMSADWPGDSSMPGMHLLGEGHMGIFSLWLGWGFGSEGPSLPGSKHVGQPEKQSKSWKRGVQTFFACMR